MYSLYIPCKVKFLENLYLLFITQTYKQFIARPDGLESDDKTQINPVVVAGQALLLMMFSPERVRSGLSLEENYAGGNHFCNAGDFLLLLKFIQDFFFFLRQTY